jgi:hypothetical protein
LLEQSSDDEIQNQQKNYGYEKNWGDCLILFGHV